MNRLNKDKQKQIITALIEGNSVRATCCMTGVAKGTVLKLPAYGAACAGCQGKANGIHSASSCCCAQMEQ